jgi:hypothetical protein
MRRRIAAALFAALMSIGVAAAIASATPASADSTQVCC